jgi:hypothetical protein
MYRRADLRVGPAGLNLTCGSWNLLAKILFLVLLERLNRGVVDQRGALVTQLVTVCAPFQPA